MGIFKSLAFVAGPVEIYVTTVEKNCGISWVFLVSNIKVSLSFFQLIKVIISQTSVVVVNSTIWILLDGFPILSQGIFIFSTFKI